MDRRVLLVETGSSANSGLCQDLHGCAVVECLSGQVDQTRTLAEQVLAQVLESAPDLILLTGPSSEQAHLCRALKFSRAVNPVPLLQVGPSLDTPAERVHPDGVLEAVSSPALVRAFHEIDTLLARRRHEGIFAELRLDLPSDLAALDRLSKRLPDWLTECSLTSFQARSLCLAVREIVANAVEWAHGNDPSRLISIDCRHDTEKVSVLIGDTGPGFDPRDLPHAARPGDPISHMRIRAERKLRDGGFGILMATGLVDQLCFSASGNESLLVQYLPRMARLGEIEDVEAHEEADLLLEVG